MKRGCDEIGRLGIRLRRRFCALPSVRKRPLLYGANANQRTCKICKQAGWVFVLRTKIRTSCALQASLQIFGRRMRTSAPPRCGGAWSHSCQPSKQNPHTAKTVWGFCWLGWLDSNQRKCQSQSLVPYRLATAQYEVCFHTSNIIAYRKAECQEKNGALSKNVVIDHPIGKASVQIQ